MDNRAIMLKRKTRIRPADDATSYILSSRDKPGFMERFIDSYKGRGVFTTQPIEPGAFVLEYRGELISAEECHSRHYSELQSTFLFEFEWQKRHWCIDASREDGSLGRLVNDNHKSPNCIMKKVMVNNRPHLCLFAVKNIEAGTEINYNYGNSKWPWRLKVTKKETPALALESETFLIEPTFQEETNKDDVQTQVINEQAPAVAVETEMFPMDLTSHEGSERDDTSTQVINEQAPALAVETEMFPMDLTSHEGSERDDTSTQVINEQAPAVAVETEMFPMDLTSHEGSERDDTSTQVFTVRGFSLVDYDDTDETDEDCVKDQPLVSNCDEVVPKLRGTESILMDRVPEFTDSLENLSDDSTEGPSTSKSEIASQRPSSDWCCPMDRVSEFSDPLYHSDESIVDETDDEDSKTDHSSLQVDDEIVPELRRTKSILMNRVPDFTNDLYDSSDDSMEVPLTSKPKMASQLPRRDCSHPIQKGLGESDVSSVDSGEEYIPNPKEESTDSDCSLELSLENKKKNKSASLSQSRSKSSSQSRSKSSSQSRSKSSSQSRSKSSSQSHSMSSHSRRFETSNNSTCGSADHVNEEQVAQTYTNTETSVSVPLEKEASVFVNPVMKKDDGSRRYNKKHHCFYCKKVVQKMSRHLFRRHNDMVDVAKAFSFPKNSKERRLQLDYIRNKGNFEHNTEVLESQKGKLIPYKQPQKKTEGQEFMHCVYCYGLFYRKVMWRHFKYCKFKPQGNASKPGKTRVQALCAFAEPAPFGFSDAYWKFINQMNQDMIAIAVKQDRCILEYGYRLFKKNEKVISQHQFIRQKLRELGRLVLAANKVAPVKTIKELIKPEMYSHVVTAARCLSGFSEDSGKYRCPSLARKVGHSLHSLAMFIKSEALKIKDKETAQDAEEFAQLYQESWKFDIASQALTQLAQAKWNSPQLLPFTKDVQNLHSHLSDKQHDHLNALQEEASPSNWKDLAKVTLAQVILFNRRREGEVSRMPLSAYLSQDTSETHEDVNLALTALEQKLCKHFVRITIVGKRGRKVPVLLTPLMRKSLDILIEKREECGVLNENGFLFALPHSVHYLRGSDCIRQFVNECDDVKNPKALTSTKLRQHIATLSTVLNLKTTELDQLADFLGHNIDVHRKHYRLPEGTLQLAKISKVLLALEQGRLGEYKGKSLDEIHIAVNETVDMDDRLQEDMEGVGLTEEQGSEDEDSVKSLQKDIPTMSAKRRVASLTEAQESDDDSVTSLQEDTCTVSAQNPRKSAKKRDGSRTGGQSKAQGSEDEDSVTSTQKCTSTQNKRKSATKRGKQMAVKRSWTPEECAAVERHLKKFILMSQIPGKSDCQSCVDVEPQALVNRDWKAVKYFIKNRITSLRRQIQ